ncbi:ommochrome-binding protein-like [Leptidea sinapis]|uniref:ommochrome-binding protein-like n=1 Tax=Leptidea sinapis TaxID=189913 RepID=UPI002120D7CE|nr:ommochrome-binding protein-like [Leptidea sinapis]
MFCETYGLVNTMFISAIILSTILTVDAKFRIFLTESPIQKIGGRLYKQELLTSNFKDPKELAYDSSTRNLYFMYMDDSIQNSGRAFINVVTKDAKTISGIQRNKATAVDAENGDVYFGSDNGLYKYDPVSNEAINVGLYNMNIFKIVIRNNEMYIIDANNHMIYKIFNLGTQAVRVGDMKTVMEFDVDFNKNIHFVTMCGVFCAISGGEVIKNKDLSVVYHFISDELKTFGVSDDGLYEIDCINGTAKKVAKLFFFPKSIIFGDYGDIFYSVEDNIYRLKPINTYHVYNIKRKNT